MAQAKHEVYKIEIKVAVLDGFKKSIKNWQEQTPDTLDPQQWRAMVDELRDEPIMHLFCAEAGIDQQVLYEWTRGQKLPSSHMCALYVNLLQQKINEYQQSLEERRVSLLEKSDPTVEQDDEQPGSQPKVVALELPEGIGPETPLKTLDGYTDLPSRVRNCLRNSNVTEAGDVLRPSESKSWHTYFLHTPNFGKVSTARLYDFLIKNGFKPVLAES